MKKPCSKCEYAFVYPLRKKIAHTPNKYEHEECRNCEKYNKYQQYRESKKKYIEGEPITSISEFEKHIPDGFMFWRGRIKHVAFLMSWQYAMLKKICEGGYIYTAIRKGDDLI
jgi:hypothetical protein